VTERLVNLRDLGGLPVANGGRTRHGMLYRSDAPHGDDVDPEHVAHWPPATVVDLRMEREAERAPYAFEGAERILHPLHEAAAPENIRSAEIGALYRHILDTAADRVAAAATHVVTRPGPALVHCTAGKDRTGMSPRTAASSRPTRPPTSCSTWRSAISNRGPHHEEEARRRSCSCVAPPANTRPPPSTSSNCTSRDDCPRKPENRSGRLHSQIDTLLGPHAGEPADGSRPGGNDDP